MMTSQASAKPDISVILTAHREGALVGASIRSAIAAIHHARDTDGLNCEIIAILDRTDQITRRTMQHGLSTLGDTLDVRIEETDEGDPGQVRNHGVKLAKGTCATFLDGDDLWSGNWLSAAWALCKERPDAVAQSMVNITFGGEKNLWWHMDSESALFDPDYLMWSNYWDAMSFAHTDIYRQTPFRANDLKLGFGHEDWHWSVITHAKGIPHKPVPETIHFKRRRKGSQMSLVDRADGVIWPN